MKLLDDVSDQNRDLAFFHGVKIVYVVVVLGGHLLLPLNTVSRIAFFWPARKM